MKLNKVRLFTVLSLLFVCLFANAQDSIFKTNGEIIATKVLEVTPSEVKFKRFDYQDGPTYSEYKSNISKIKFSNGVIDDFKNPAATYKKDDYFTPAATPPKPQSNKIDISGSRYIHKDTWYREKGIQKVLLDTKDKQISSLVAQSKTAKGLQYIGFLGIPFGVAAAISGILALETYSYGYPSNAGAYAAVFAVAAVACPIASIGFKIKRKRDLHGAINLHNEKYGK